MASVPRPAAEIVARRLLGGSASTLSRGLDG